MKKLIKGTKAAIEIDSAKEEKIERISTKINSIFLCIDKQAPILLRIFRGEVELLFLKFVDTFFIYFLTKFYSYNKAKYGSS